MNKLAWLCVVFGIIALIGCIEKALQKDWTVSGIREIAGILWFMLGVMLFKWTNATKIDGYIKGKLREVYETSRKLEYMLDEDEEKNP